MAHGPSYRLSLIPQGNSLKQPRACILSRGEKRENQALSMGGCGVVLKIKLILCLVFNYNHYVNSERAFWA